MSHFFINIAEERIKPSDGKALKTNHCLVERNGASLHRNTDEAYIPSDLKMLGGRMDLLYNR
ncbi:hypothetical protein BS333_09995 [Vibrio azureus]|nr:hypothetical protein BS333_09995 [Vibrio azureus]